MEETIQAFLPEAWAILYVSPLEHTCNAGLHLLT